MQNTKDQSYNEWLVINSQLGSESAFNELAKQWQKRLFLYAMRKLDDPDGAREAVQECLLSVTRNLKSLNDPGAFPKWCYQILDRRCNDYLRKAIRQRNQQLNLSEQQAESASVENDSNSSLEQELTVEKLLRQLDPKLSLLLKLYYQESFSISEIAQITNTRAGTVKSRLYYARKMLATLLED